MKRVRDVVLGTLAIVAAAEGTYVLKLRGDVQTLAQRMQTLETATSTRRSDPPLASLTALADVLHAGGGVDPSGSRVAPDDVQRMVATELAKHQDQERQAAEDVLRQAADDARSAVGQYLTIGDVDLGRLEALGDALREREEALFERSRKESGRETQVAGEHLALWKEMDDNLHRLLGDAKYTRLAALRREHPEFARTLYALRPSPSPATPVAAGDPGPATGQPGR